jgi:anti-anti-sigma factor
MTSRPFFRTNAIGDVMLLELCGEISSLADHTVLNELDEIRQERREVGFTKLIVDLAQAPFFGSSLLELIRVLWKDISGESGKLVLCNPSAVGREVLQVAKFDQLWPLVETRAQAISLLDSARDVEKWPPKLQEFIAQYDAGPTVLRESLEGLSAIQLRTPAPPGAWSALQVVCHIADFELVYADRMKRVVAENRPALMSGDPDVFAEKLAYAQRDVEDELDVIISIRREVSRFLKTLSAADFERTGVHSTDGPLTLAQLLERIASHIPHHVKFIEGKRTALKARQTNSHCN